MQLQGKVVVVTGGGNGIGQQIVLQLLEKGATVAAVDIQPAALQETRTLAGPKAETLSLHQTDISSRDSIAGLVDEVLQQHGCVDVIINNAGIIHPFEPISGLDYKTIDRVINVNLYGVLNMVKAFLPHLLERPQAHIVNVSSMGGLFAFPKQTLYGATKAAVKLLSEGLYSELKKTSVGVTVVFPGAVKTQILKNSEADPKRLDKLPENKVGTPPNKVAARIINAVEKNRFKVNIGIDSKIFSVLYRLFPQLTIRLLGKIMEAALPD